MARTRTQVIFLHVNKLLHSTGTSWPSFAAEVREQYHALVPKPLRKIEFSCNLDAYDRQRLDAQTLRRFEHDTRHGLPADLEEAIVLAMEGVYRHELQKDLNARTGLLAAHIPEGEHADVAGVAELTLQFSEALTALAPMIADGKIDHRDALHAERAVSELTDVLAAATTIIHQVGKILPGESFGTIRAVRQG